VSEEEIDMIDKGQKQAVYRVNRTKIEDRGKPICRAHVGMEKTHFWREICVNK